MKNRITIYTIQVIMVVVISAIHTSCTFEEEIDPNGPIVGGLDENANIKQLNEIAIGIEATVRNGLGVETTASGSLARELYLFDADPRNTGDLLGKNGIALDNNSFYSTAQFIGSYRAIKGVSILLNALDNTAVIDESQKNAYRGYAKTFKAYELIQVLKSYDKARIDVEDFDNLGPFLEFEEAIGEIRSLLDEAFNDLQGFGPLDQFLFPIAGFGDLIDTSAETETMKRADKNQITVNEFILFNRAVAAVAAVYDGDGNGALQAIDASYFALNRDLNFGPKHIFGLGAGDLANPVFRAPSVSAEQANNADQIIVHDSWINEAEPNDSRVTSKTKLRPDPSVQDGLTGAYESALYGSNTSPIDIIRNEELILVYAEASILATNLEDAEDALNVIRNSANLPDYSGDQTVAALTTEMLRQRRYSLWSENHRMFDLRRYNLSNTLPIDRTGDQIFNVLPVPLSENL